MFKFLVFLLMLSYNAACANYLNVNSRIILANNIASSNRFQALQLETSDFVMRGYMRLGSKQDDVATVYIEGDGVAWITRYQASSDPTPANPISLRLAVVDKHSNVIYIARPCQYVLSKNPSCNLSLWTGGRFSKKVINAYNECLDAIKQQYKFKKFRLVGYSGGAAVAALVAVRRKDIVALITFAGNLDHTTWTTYHSISPLRESLNPIDFARLLEKIPQIHFVGEQDKVIDKSVINNYLNHFSSLENVRVIYVSLGHNDAWEQIWSNFLSLRK